MGGRDKQTETETHLRYRIENIYFQDLKYYNAILIDNFPISEYMLHWIFNRKIISLLYSKVEN